MLEVVLSPVLSFLLIDLPALLSILFECVARRWGRSCDQVLSMDIGGTRPRRLIKWSVPYLNLMLYAHPPVPRRRYEEADGALGDPREDLRSCGPAGVCEFRYLDFAELRGKKYRMARRVASFYIVDLSLVPSTISSASSDTRDALRLA